MDPQTKLWAYEQLNFEWSTSKAHEKSDTVVLKEDEMNHISVT